MIDQVTPLLEDWNYVASLLSTATGLPDQEVRQRLMRELDVLCANVCDAAREWGLKPHVWSRDTELFYASTDAFLFDTLIWSQCRSKSKMRRWIIDYLRADGRHGARILTHGDGLGIDSCYFAQEGHRVDYYDISDKCKVFAQGLANSAGLHIHNIRSLEAIPDGSYDYIIQLDVLEHVPDPPSVVKELSRLLKAEGRLIIHAPFWQTDNYLPTHLLSNRKYCGEVRHLFEQFSLIPIAGTFLWMPVVFEKVTDESSFPALSLTQKISLRLNQTFLRLIGMNSSLLQLVARRVSVAERAAIRKRADALQTVSSAPV